MTTIEQAPPSGTINSLDALMGRIVDLDGRKHDFVADTRAMSVRVDTDGGEDETPGPHDVWLDIDHADGLNSLKLNQRARAQMSNDIGIPRRYFERMRTDAPDLLVDNAHHWLQTEPERRLVRGLDDTGRAWLSDRYYRLDHIEIARTLLPELEQLGTDVQFHQAAITEDRLYIRATLPRLTAEVKVGDTVQWGVEIRNSEVGQGSLSIAGFVLNLVCINGMTVSHDLTRRHVGRRIELDGILSNEAVAADDTAFWLAARDVLRNTITETRFQEVVAQLRDAASSTPIEKPINATEVLASRFSLSDDERQLVLGHLVSGGDLSRWGALNAVTAAAKESESFDRQAEMEEMGWAMAAMPEREWDRVAASR